MSDSYVHAKPVVLPPRSTVAVLASTEHGVEHAPFDAVERPRSAGESSSVVEVPPTNLESCADPVVNNSQLAALHRWSVGNGLSASSIPTGPAQHALPPIESFAESLSERLVAPLELVHGLVHKGTKVSLAGGSKSNKTWSLLALAIAVSLGIPWWGFPTVAGKVLFLNFEVHKYFMLKRVEAILAALDANVPRNLSFWHLRGYACAAEKIIPIIIERIKSHDFAMVIIDPTYKLMAGRDENSAGAVGELLNMLELVAVQTGAALVFATHFSKGNQAGRDVLDRTSGSGVFARDPDTILTLTKHAEDGAFVVEPVLRNFAPVKPFALRWEHPLMHVAADLDPAELRRPAQGRRTMKRLPTLDEFIAIFPDSYKTDPSEAILKSEQIAEEFANRRWDAGCIRQLRDEAFEAGRLKIHHGARNRLSIGRPSMVDDWLSGLQLLTPIKAP